MAIDGPAGSGKSTIARLLAGRLGYTYIDTGAFYRAVTWLAMQRGIDLNNGKLLADLASTLKFSFIDGRMHVNGQDLSVPIRRNEVSRNTSFIARVPQVRSILVRAQQAMASKGYTIMEGRDIGTVVLPDAKVKFFLDADPAERARRRHDELAKRGKDIPVKQILDEILVRDANDRNRSDGPLVAADDTIMVDTTAMNIEEVIAYLEKEVPKANRANT